MFDRILYSIFHRTSELSAMIVGLYAPNLWLEFLNANPRDGESMWPVYVEFTSFMEALKAQHSLSRELIEMKLLSEEEFLETYPLELQEDAEKLHGGMKYVIDDNKVDIFNALVRPIPESDADEDEVRFWLRDVESRQAERAEAERTLTRGASLPELFFTASFESTEEAGLYEIHLHTPSANHKSFWLSVIYEGMVTLSHRAGKIITRRCAAPDCRKYFVPTPHSHGQKYHSKTCRSRHNMQKLRKVIP